MAVTELKKLVGIAAICVVGGCVSVADKGLTGAAAPDFSANKSADEPLLTNIDILDFMKRLKEFSYNLHLSDILVLKASILCKAEVISSDP